jgi:hypothetical protein
MSSTSRPHPSHRWTAGVFLAVLIVVGLAASSALVGLIAAVVLAALVGLAVGLHERGHDGGTPATG